MLYFVLVGLKFQEIDFLKNLSNSLLKFTISFII